MTAIDKAARLAAEAAAAAQATAAQAQRLDPPFPWRVEPFDGQFFGVTEADAKHGAKL